jgi:signal transduction histidine kinase
MHARTALSNNDKRTAALSESETMPTILIVDDDIHARLILGKHIQRLGYTAIEVPSGREALALLFGESAVPVDMIISDVWMPGMSGIDLLKAVHERAPDLPVAMISACVTLESSLEAINSGAFAYITKPFRSEAIAQVVARGMKRIEELRLREALERDFARLAQLDQQLQNASMMQNHELLGNLIVGLRHELGNIVSAIVLNLEVLRQSQDLPDSLRQNLEDLQASANDLSALIARFRDYPHAETLNADVDLREVVIAAIDVARARPSAAQVEISYDSGEEQVWVRGAEAQLKRAVLNLLDNAVEAAQRRVQVSLIENDGRAVLIIADDGSGFDRKLLENAFLPTATTKSREGFMSGLGLGLFITRMVISLHGGSIRLENRPEGGAQAILELPMQVRVE